MTVLALEKMDADDLFEALLKTHMASEIEAMEISDGAAKINIDGVQCNTIAFHLIYGIAEKKDIEKILNEQNLKFAWL